MIPGSPPFVRQAFHVEEAGSTNDLARDLVGQGRLALPALVLADRQTRGRGQGTNAWWSDLGSLTFTLALDPASHGLTPAHEPRVALASALALVRAIRRGYPRCPAGLRWPNDVEAGGRKLGGILSERVESPDGPRLLVGIGLNVTTRLDEAPEEVRRMAGSLADWGRPNRPEDARASVLEGFLIEFGPVLEALAAGRAWLAEGWNQADTLAGSTVRVRVGPEVVEGRAEGIDESGGLRLRVAGQPRVIHAGRVLRDPGPGG